MTAHDLVIITPSRERPERLVEMYDAVRDMSTLDTHLVVCVDDDDPRLTDYRRLANLPGLSLWTGERRSLSGWTNHAAERLLDSDEPPRFLASLGDDHLPRTPGWDRVLVHAIENLGGLLGGWSWGKDGLRADLLPTYWAVSAPVARRLGYVMLSACEHMYVDNAVRDLAQASQRAVICPDVLVEHVHPVNPAHRALWDASYEHSNRREQYDRDRRAYERWRDGQGFQDDVTKLIPEELP
jgi:hypothetical protein